MPDYIREGKIPMQHLYFVLIAAVESFEVDSFYLPHLRMPKGDSTLPRDFQRKDPGKCLQGFWATQRIEFRVKNPCV